MATNKKVKINQDVSSLRLSSDELISLLEKFFALLPENSRVSFSIDYVNGNTHDYSGIKDIEQSDFFDDIKSLSLHIDSPDYKQSLRFLLWESFGTLVIEGDDNWVSQTKEKTLKYIHPFSPVSPMLSAPWLRWFVALNIGFSFSFLMLNFTVPDLFGYDSPLFLYIIIGLFFSWSSSDTLKKFFPFIGITNQSAWARRKKLFNNIIVFLGIIGTIIAIIQFVM